MNTHAIAPVQTLLHQAASLLVYQTVLSDAPGQAFLALLQTIRHAERNTAADNTECLHAYGNWFSALADCKQSWQDYLLTQVLNADNPFTQQAQRSALQDISPALVAAARHDLQVLQQIYTCSSDQLSQWVKVAAHLTNSPVVWSYEEAANLDWLRSTFHEAPDWGDGVEPLAAHYRKQGVGLFAQYKALQWQAGQLIGIGSPDRVQVTDLVGYDAQKEALLKNTAFLLKGYPALHVLLYGSRGSGKSSLVKGLLHRYGDDGLRLIEVAKAALADLPAIVEQLRDLPQKFIIFVDDLSFEEDDDVYKALKVVLEGNLTARSQNVVVYATSNRRHLIREFFGDRPRPSDGDEVHAWDTVQEKLSFSDRFGLTLTFEPANQTTYLQIIHHLAKQADIQLDAEALEFQALQWATRHNGRSGRSARQFIDFLSAELTGVGGAAEGKDRK
ncbi:ATP-binding protein [Stenomitos frigidus]|uniref:AAA+ family ATPase n=1 Tax=Stenomitos frigidus ULC18 TaxID=2107698 RepID=A0A2T1EQZ9_9CYAN|nr:ATP-binding protein [Stenomitos frigidus]PSB35155.1 AAA+ family ATPase [Stenomitos frigidus ULC18]